MWFKWKVLIEVNYIRLQWGKYVIIIRLIYLVKINAKSSTEISYLSIYLPLIHSLELTWMTTPTINPSVKALCTVEGRVPGHTVQLAVRRTTNRSVPMNSARRQRHTSPVCLKSPVPRITARVNPESRKRIQW